MSNLTDLISKAMISALGIFDCEVCLDCGRRNTGHNWCQVCNSNHFKRCFCKWSSGNRDIDRFIRNIQINALSRNRVLEWIPYDQLTDFKMIGRGGFGNVQEATWVEGQIDLMIGWNYLQKRWERHGKTKVAVKILDHSRNISVGFFKETMAYFRTPPIVPNNVFNRLIRIFGISKNPSTQKYLIIMQFAEDGSLKSYLERNYSTITWNEKLFILNYIAESLKNIHASGLICKNFHSGNILLHQGIPLIGDLGLCRPVNKFEEREVVYGVLPYVAPEVLRNKEYTKESDIYSFAFIMWEMCTHRSPFYDRFHDISLALGICLGERPEIPEGAPSILINLVRKCWNAIPSKRPNAEEVFNSINTWYTDVSQKKVTMYYFDFNVADIWKEASLLDDSYVPIKHHPGAHYHSRLLDFSRLPKAINLTVNRSASLENFARDSFQ